jgi:hypothetical protein
MKRNNKADTLCPAVSSTMVGKPTVKEPSAEGGEPKAHRTLMTRGELIFYLRDVHRYWSTSRMSNREIEELEQQNLIQRSTTDICAIRLTEHGTAVKNGGAKAP